eukprot:3417811-Pyramimonas_sp.AAC.1
MSRLSALSCLAVVSRLSLMMSCLCAATCLSNASRLPPATSRLSALTRLPIVRGPTLEDWPLGLC